MSLFTELKRRNVIKVAAVYAAISWLLLQGVALLQEPLRLPDWTLNLFLLLALFGFPLTLILAWALELSPQGLKKTDAGPKNAAKIKFGLLLVVVFVGVLAALLLNR